MYNKREFVKRLYKLYGTSCDMFDPIHGIAIDGDVGLMKHALKHVIHIDYTDSDNMTALLLAAKHGNVGVVNLLLQSGANPNHRGSGGETLIAYAMNDIGICNIASKYNVNKHYTIAVLTELVRVSSNAPKITVLLHICSVNMGLKRELSSLIEKVSKIETTYITGNFDGMAGSDHFPNRYNDGVEHVHIKSEADYKQECDRRVMAVRELCQINNIKIDIYND